MKFIRNICLSLLALAAVTGTSKAAFVPVTGDVAVDTRWTADNVYILTRLIAVTNGATLQVEPGTLIRGIDNQLSELPNEPGVLVISRGSLGALNGTPEKPIILTSIDDPNVPGGAATIPPSFLNALGNVKTLGVDYGAGSPAARDFAPGGNPGDNGFAYSGLWGGLIILGRDYVAANTVPGGLDGIGGPNNVTDTNADGIPDADTSVAGWANPDPQSGLARLPLFTKTGVARPTSAGGLFIPLIGTTSSDNGNGTGTDYIEGADLGVLGAARSVNVNYGGVDEDDCSGWFRWVQVRYSGFQIGLSNEINSITTGALGSATAMQFCEASFNLDDGFEFFSGSQDTSFMFSHYIQDDSFDGDEGYRGCNQFWFAVQGSLSEVRGGFAGPGNGMIVGQVDLSNTYDQIAEWDGSETVVGDNQGGIPQTNFTVYCTTGITERRGLRMRREAIGNWFNVAMQLSSGSSQATLDLYYRVNDAASQGNAGNSHYFSDGIVDLAAGETGNPTNGVPGNIIEEAAPLVVGDLRYTAGGLDPRSVGPARTPDGLTPPADKCFQRFAGFQRNNTFLKGWTHLDALGVVSNATPFDRVIPGAVKGTATTVLTWPVPSNHPADTIYWILCSENQCDWVSLGTVQDDQPINGTTTDAADQNAAAGVLAFDTGAAPVPGQIRYYVVVAN